MKIRRMILLLLSAVMCCGAFSACGSDEGGIDAQYKDRPNKVSVMYGVNAYGKEWITACAKDYMDNYNTDTYIDLKQTVVQTEEFSKIQSGISSRDLYLMDLHLEDGISAFADISDVYNSTALGETTLIKDKVNKVLYAHKLLNGTQNYVMPYQDVAMGYSFSYNKTVLDETFPNGYTLPRTTDELFELGDRLKANKDKDGKTKTYLLTCSFGDTNDYTSYCTNAWFAQIIGNEPYDNYFNGKYWDETQSKYVFDSSAATVISKNQTQWKDWWNIISKLSVKSNGYIYNDSSSMAFMDSLAQFAGFGFGKNSAKSAFMASGMFLENDMSFLLEEKKSTGDEQVIGIMKLPVASAVIKRTSTISNDAVLRNVIDYVDGVVSEKPNGVSDADIETIREARNVGSSYMGGGMVIPKNASNIAGAKEFIRYLASDRASVIASKAVLGLPLLPYGKTPTEEELGFERTYFVNNVIDGGKNITKIVSSDCQEYTLSYYTDFGLVHPSYPTIKAMFNGTDGNVDTVYNAMYNYFNSRWGDMMTILQQAGVVIN